MIPDPFRPEPEYDRLLLLLRAGERIEAHRATLEACFGLWSDDHVLCEDGRATRLTRPHAHTAVYLTRTGEILVVHPVPRSDVFRARLFTGPADIVWQALEILHPDAIPGRGTVPRYWVLRENITPVTAIYGVYDLLDFEVVERAPDRDTIVYRVDMANAAGCAAASGAACAHPWEDGPAVLPGVGL